MCGIVGYMGHQDATPVIMCGLKMLEYRGYDSAGICTMDDGDVEIRRSSGKLVNLERLLKEQPLHGTIGIGHTRWATHGKPTVANAHPHKGGAVVVVHNGIIENYLPLKEISYIHAEGHPAGEPNLSCRYPGEVRLCLRYYLPWRCSCLPITLPF